MDFPAVRMRDRRSSEAARKKHREIPEVRANDLIMPLFIKEGISKRAEIKSMPGIYQFPVKDIAKEALKVYISGVGAIILFGIPLDKDRTGSSAYTRDGIVQKAIRAIKKKVPRLTVIGDVCLCEYTSHGHCGIINERKKGDVDNDLTIKALARVAVSYADAGVDIVAPSAMMDGQVKRIKEALVRNGYKKVKIMAYSAKYASSFYGPFRDAAESPPKFGDRRSYQMDYHNSDEAVMEARLDIKEGADSIMVKPALGYEDIIYRLRKAFKAPLACYSVSGEYAMIKAAALKGYLDERKVVTEMLTGFKRAGADSIITYYAMEAAGWLKNKKRI
ncbi:MAG: delta-aminolevulinic acid dehydratase [Candidatus Omnitrophica bacterium CG1_02_49_10]|nr:MAG: delta-aminolevulinic acid dehydratase [Candidatus Omnitrophica bacterium CG1_02_49_10]